MNKDEIIKKAREGFDNQLHTDQYKKKHSDDNHLKKLIDFLPVKENENYLDLGTGNGYAAFELAVKNRNINVYGLDIAVNSIKENIKLKRKLNIPNISFKSYDGYSFPYKENFFYGVLSRYAFHHFPDIELTINELKRIIKPGGFFLLSDPVTYKKDNMNFIDKFQALLPDGHVHFYRKDEIINIFESHGFIMEKSFESSIRYSRKYSKDYERLLTATPEEILKIYKTDRFHNKIYIEVSILNILFKIDF
jgi:ubiquinone/menaquinone biosynthesis C-methylase UbiE